MDAAATDGRWPPGGLALGVSLENQVANALLCRRSVIGRRSPNLPVSASCEGGVLASIEG